MTFQTLNVLIVAAYLPPVSIVLPSAAVSAKFDSLCTYIDRIQQLHPQDKMIIVHAINLCRVNWVNADVLYFVILEAAIEFSIC